MQVFAGSFDARHPPVQLRPLVPGKDTKMPFYSPAHLKAHPEITAHGLSLGRDARTADELVIPDRDRTMSLHIIGKAGSGKSSELKNLIYQDGLDPTKAVILVDPHGDAVDEVIAELAQAAIARTFVLDMRDEAYPFGLNVFSMAGALTTEEERSQTVSRIYHVFKLLWPEVEKQQYLPMLLRYAIIALLDYPGATLVDMLDFFRKDEFRAQILSKVHDKSIREYFADEFDQQGPAERARRVAPLMNRLYTLFVGRSIPRNIFGQRRNSINFRRAIENHEIILVKLPTTTMEDDAKLMGAFIVAEASAAVLSFSDTPADRRPATCLYVDEVQNFASEDFKRIVTEGRKFNMRLTIAHQFLGQLPGYLQDAVKGVHTTVVFRINSDDARALAPIFPPRSAAVGSSDEYEANVCKYLLKYPPQDLHVRTFLETYLRPLQHQTHAGKVEILSERHIGVLDMIMPGAVNSEGKKAPTEERDPTLYLDNLFLDVMRQQSWLLDIPYEAVAGFANCNGGFYKTVKWARGTQDLTANVQFPSYLVNHTAQGFVWLRKPENAHERFLHCVFHLRMVMRYLATHPLVKASAVKHVDYAEILMQLPVRMALVKSGDDVGQIITNDTPTPLTGEALSARRYFIQQHTRQRYCHPRDQIERLIDDTTPPDAFTLQRWEEVESDDAASKQSSVPGNADLRPAAAQPAPAAPPHRTAADDAALQPRIAEDGQSTYARAYGAWVRAIRRDSQP